MGKELKTLTKQYEITFIEMAERGKDLEKLFRILVNCKDQIQDSVVQKMWEIYKPYILRNTPDCHDHVFKTLHEKFKEKNTELEFRTTKVNNPMCKDCKDKNTYACRVCVFSK